MTEKELKAIASQLSCPSGGSGLEIAKKMNQSNLGMILNTIESLKLEKENHVLELGHGNAIHLNEILKQANDISYFGLEISESMKVQSEKLNKKLVKKNQSKFSLYDGNTIPFLDHYFDKIMSINTIYFWGKPLFLLAEIYRVLKKDGVCSIAFASMSFMKTLPFVDSRFELYDANKVKILANKIPFRSIEIIDKTETVESKTGDTVNREYTIVKFTK
ncbi:class I SAM-dependent methyltransferase [Aquimarina sp. Aq78]|uniref:class I SAM-dependent methyltransferase n=1 Tax=Aquimarina sp. Aq78 TaxID=1191889 RepID=UPI0018FF10B9|nr:class I SAM-dependent methyltransferase [Aquimarina sp. Aq78]